MMLMPWQERPLVDLPLSQLRDVTLARLKEMDRANANANVIAYYDANLCFHWKIIAASGYAQILAVYRGIVQKLYLARLTNLSSNVGIQISVHEHRAIFDSIRNGKSAECEALMANHVTAAKVRLFSLSKQGGNHATSNHV